ncbi:MAG: hypothetical protein EOO43_06910 [Flavobacterium sp.]|nr:MAG: hypothetical protein EOO43_06910 [Flavobacterium sp.]
MTIKEKILSTFKGKEGRTFKPHEIIDLIKQKYPDTNPSSIIPADRCYNKINIGIEKYFDFHVFEALDDGSYKFLGEGYPFSGPVFWNGKVVGEWLDGRKIILQELK